MLTEGVAAAIVWVVDKRARRPDRFEAVVGEWLNALRSDRTRSAYRGDLTLFAAWVSADNGAPSALHADTEQVGRFRTACAAAGASDSTIARRTSAMRSFFEYAVATGVLDASPIEPWRRSSPPAASSTQDLDPRDVIAVAGASRQLGDRTVVLVGLMLFDGLRLSDVLAADASDVSFNARHAEISVARGDGFEAIQLDARTASAMRHYLDGRRTGPLLLGESPTRTPSRLTRFGADYLIKQAGTRAGLAVTLSANALRRGYVACSHAAGMPIDVIQARLGHSDVRTTRRHLAVDSSPVE